MKTTLPLLLLVAPMLCAAAAPNQVEAHWLATMQKDYRDAALVVIADVSSDGQNVIIDTREVWKAAPGYTPGRILIPKKACAESRPEPRGIPGVKRSLVFFYLKGVITQWGGCAIENDRVRVAPDYTLPELRKTLEATLDKSIVRQGLEQSLKEKRDFPKW